MPVQGKPQEPPAVVLWTAITWNSFGSPQPHGQGHDIISLFCWHYMSIYIAQKSSSSPVPAQTWRLRGAQKDLLGFFSFLPKFLTEFWGSCFWIKNNFSEQLAVTSWLWVSAKVCWKCLKVKEHPIEISHYGSWGQQELSVAAGLGASRRWAQQGWSQLLFALIKLSSRRPRRLRNMIFSYYEHQSASCNHIFLFQKK